MFFVGIPDFIGMPSTGWPCSSHDKNKCRHSECSCLQHWCYLLKFTQGTIPSRQISVAQGESGGEQVIESYSFKNGCCCVFLADDLTSHRTASTCVNRLKTKTDKNAKHKPLKIYFPELWKICCSFIEFFTGKLQS